MFDQDFKEFIELLNANHVRYLIVGGYAMAFHGHPRYTKDLDIWVEYTAENTVELIKALEQFGMGSLGLTSTDFSEPDQVVQLGFPPYRIDIMTTASGVEFADAYEHRTKTTVNGVEIDFINLTDLKKNKKATGRLQDMADLEKLGE